jgi:DNA-binding response OmpR family regulator
MNYYDVMNEEQDVRQKIVIVEDNFALADIYKTRLTILGYNCFTAGDGEEALELIEKVTPDLVLLDLMIPKISGGEVLKKMRSTDWGKSIRVYIISNLNEEQAPADLRELGIEGYAVKANLHNDDIDNLVDKILTPPDQEEGISLEGTEL